MNEVLKPDAGQSQDVELGEWLGRRQAYSLVAGTCSAADAKCLNEIRENKKYKRLGLNWEDFCKQRLGMHRATADEIIRQFREFGAAYFTLRQITGVTPDEYRVIRGQIEDGSLQWRDGSIPIQAEQAPRLLEAVRDLAPPPMKNPKPPAGADDGPTPILLAEEALLEAEVQIKKLSKFRVSYEDRQRISDLISKLSIEMQLQRHLL
jgi:hypothetical protein